MERLKNMSLRRAFFLLTVCGLVMAVTLASLLWGGCRLVSSQYPLGGLIISIDGVMTPLPQPTPEQLRLLNVLDIVSLLGWVVFPAAGLGVAGTLFYRCKLKEPIRVLMEGTRRIQTHDLDFSLPTPSADELGQICAAFENMRLELLKTNQELWRQAEERKRLNAAFAHDLRNPITVLKGSLKLLRNGMADEQTIDRLESYTLRMEQYVEAMSSIQRIEQMPVRINEVTASTLRTELEETAGLFAPALHIEVSVPDMGTLRIDHGMFLNVAENLIGNAARFAQTKIRITLAIKKDILLLSVIDDGPGFPAELIKNGPQPFGRAEVSSEHFGMGLYSSSLLCQKHGGNLRLENSPAGTVATTSIQINFKS